MLWADTSRRAAPKLLLWAAVLFIAFGVLVALVPPTPTPPFTDDCGGPAVVVDIREAMRPERPECSGPAQDQLIGAAVLLGVGVVALVGHRRTRRWAPQRTSTHADFTGQTFAMPKPRFGRSPGWVGIAADGVVIQYSLVKGRLTIPMAAIAAASDRTVGQDVVLRRDARVLALTAKRGPALNVGLVLRQPVRVEHFRFGAENTLAISRRERRRGADVDVIGLRVDEPVALLDALAALGVDVETSVVDALIEVIGVPMPGLELDDRRRQVRRAARRRRALAIGLPILAVTLNGARVYLAVHDRERPVRRDIVHGFEVDAPPAGAYATPADSSTVVDLASAETAFDALYVRRSVAVHNLDRRSIEVLETGAAEALDLRLCDVGCPTPTVPDARVTHSLSAPPQHAYPAYFVASVPRTGTKGQPVIEVVVFTRDGPSEPWLIALDVSAGSSNPLLAYDSTGFSLPPPQVDGPPAASYIDLLARELQAYADRAPIAAGRFNENVAIRGADIVTEVSSTRAGGAVVRKMYEADARATYAVAGIGGEPLVCGVLHIRSVFAPTWGVLRQAKHRPDYPILAPGTYSQVRLHAVQGVCVLVTADGVGHPIWSHPMDIEASGDPA